MPAEKAVSMEEIKLDNLAILSTSPRFMSRDNRRSSKQPGKGKKNIFFFMAFENVAKFKKTSCTTQLLFRESFILKDARFLLDNKLLKVFVFT